MGYSYTNGDGVSVLLTTEPNGATEPVSNLDDAIKQIKAWIRDTTSNVGAAGMQSAITALQSAVSAIPASVVGQGLCSIGLSAQQDVVFAGAGDLQGTVQFNTKVFDPDSAFNAVSYKFVAPFAGYYFFSAVVTTSISGGSPTEIDQAFDFYKNGSVSTIGLNRVDGTEMKNGGVFTGCGVIQLAANDEVTLRYDFNVNGAVTVGIQPISSRFDAYRIR